uniref:Uncharacterized protein n=1 Tax=Acanthochromis polyacanthus TaxID=80966 RepID=A0A3Q1F0W2_9TELE
MHSCENWIIIIIIILHISSCLHYILCYPARSKVNVGTFMSNEHTETQRRRIRSDGAPEVLVCVFGPSVWNKAELNFSSTHCWFDV